MQTDRPPLNLSFKSVYSSARKEVSELRGRVETFQKFILYLDIFSILTFLAICLTELSLGVQLYSSSTQIEKNYYYAMIKSYISSIDFMLKFDYKGEDFDGRCDNTTYDGNFTFNQIRRFKGICMNKDFDNTTNKTLWKMDMSGEYPNKTACQYSELTLDAPILVDPYMEGKICFKKKPAFQMLFKFVKESSPCNSTNEKELDYQICGRFGGYKLCVKSDECPIFYITMNETQLKLGNVSYDTFMTSKPWMPYTTFKCRTVTETDNYAFFLFKFTYGNMIYSEELSDLKQEYVDFLSEGFVDFSKQNPANNRPFFSILSDTVYERNAKTVLDNNTQIIRNNNTLEKNAVFRVTKYPKKSFQFSYKQIPFPYAKCLGVFEGQSYFQKMNLLFVKFLLSAVPRYVSWVIVELFFIAIFYIYIKGYLSYRQFKREKINHNDKISATVSQNTITIFHYFVIFIKTFTLLFTMKRLNLKIDFIGFLYSKECYDDRAFMNSLWLLGEDLKPLVDKIRFCLWLILAEGCLIALKVVVFIYYYYGLYKKFEELKARIKYKQT